MKRTYLSLALLLVFCVPHAKAQDVSTTSLFAEAATIKDAVEKGESRIASRERRFHAHAKSAFRLTSLTAPTSEDDPSEIIKYLKETVPQLLTDAQGMLRDYESLNTAIEAQSTLLSGEAPKKAKEIARQFIAWSKEESYQDNAKTYLALADVFESYAAWCLSHQGQIAPLQDQLSANLPFVKGTVLLLERTEAALEVLPETNAIQIREDLLVRFQDYAKRYQLLQETLKGYRVKNEPAPPQIPASPEAVRTAERAAESIAVRATSSAKHQQR